MRGKLESRSGILLTTRAGLSQGGQGRGLGESVTPMEGWCKQPRARKSRLHRGLLDQCLNQEPSSTLLDQVASGCPKTSECAWKQKCRTERPEPRSKLRQEAQYLALWEACGLRGNMGCSCSNCERVFALLPLVNQLLHLCGVAAGSGGRASPTASKTFRDQLLNQADLSC